MKIRLLIILVIFCAVALMTGVQPQFSAAQSEEAMAKIVGVRGDSLVLIEGDIETLIEQSENAIYPLQANSRGDVIYMYWTEDTVVSTEGQRLLMHDGQESRLITETFWIHARPYFSDDDHVVYVSNVPIETLTDEGGMPYSVTPVLRLDLATDETEEIDTFDIRPGGGGGGSSYAMDHVLAAEVFSSGFSQIPNFYDVELYSITLNNFAAGRIVAVAPDRSQVVTYAQNNEGFNLSVRDVASDTTTPLYSSEQRFMSSYWGEDGFLYVASSSQMAPSYPLLTDDEKDALRDSFEIGWNWNLSQQAQLQRIDPDSGEAMIIYLADNVWAFTRITTLDGYLYWSQIPDGTEFVEAFRNGDFEGEFSTQLIPDQVLPDVYRMPLEGGDVELIAEGVQRFIPLPSGSSD